VIRIPRLHVEEVTIRLPADMPFDVASFTEPLACAVRAVQRSGVLPGDRIAVISGGGMGLLIAQAVAAREAIPVVLDISADRIALARTLKLKATINPLRENLRGAVAEMTGGVGLDGAILTALSEPILAQVQEVLRPGGRINIVAGPTDGPRLTVDLADLFYRELAILSTYSSTPHALAEAFELLARKQVQVLPLISHCFPLAAFDEGVELQRNGKATKVIFHP
jgi:threonine dehydrogenase-like Zn-dependent dehydrogenase